ncbi:MAG: trehalose-phosphatase [Pseudomonadota bacterium]
MTFLALKTTPLPDPEQLFADISPALFLDIDGTLIDIAATPDTVLVAPNLPDLLIRLHARLDGAVALVTGRKLDDIDHLFGTLPLAAAGQHGLEQRNADGKITRHRVDSGLMAGIASRLSEFASTHPGIQVEDKGLTVALHYRNAPSAEHQARLWVKETMRDADGELSLHDGKMVLEIKPNGIDKGTAVRDLMTRPPFFARSPIYIGDDVTDEDGFRAANSLGGTSILVGERETTEARFRIDSIHNTLTLLAWFADRWPMAVEELGR